MFQLLNPKCLVQPDSLYRLICYPWILLSAGSRIGTYLSVFLSFPQSPHHPQPSWSNLWYQQGSRDLQKSGHDWCSSRVPNGGRGENMLSVTGTWAVATCYIALPPQFQCHSWLKVMSQVKRTSLLWALNGSEGPIRQGLRLLQHVMLMPPPRNVTCTEPFKMAVGSFRMPAAS